MRFLLWRLPWLLVAVLSLVMLTIPWLPVFLTLTPIDAVTSVRQLMQEEQYAAAAEQVDYFLDISTDEPERLKLQQLAGEIGEQRSRWSYQADKIVTEGLLTGHSDEWTGQLAGAMSAFMVLGEVRDLAGQGLLWLRDQPVDDGILVLSSLGLLATTAQWVSLGTATPLKSSVTLLSLAHKAGSLPPWLITALKGGLSRAWEIRSLSPLKVNLSRITELTERVGLGPGLALLGQTRGPGALQRLVVLARHLGPATGPVVHIGGEAALALAPAVGKLGVANVKLASRFGPEGLQAMQAYGVLRFMKYGVRLAKFVIFYPWIVPLAKGLLKLPVSLWHLGVVLGVTLALRRPGFRRRHSPL